MAKAGARRKRGSARREKMDVVVKYAIQELPPNWMYVWT
jgi:hypothetical protein